MDNEKNEARVLRNLLTQLREEYKPLDTPQLWTTELIAIVETILKLQMDVRAIQSTKDSLIDGLLTESKIIYK